MLFVCFWVSANVLAPGVVGVCDPDRHSDNYRAKITKVRKRNAKFRRLTGMDFGCCYRLAELSSREWQ